MNEAMAQARADGVMDMVFGDLFLEDIRAYREEKLAKVGMRAHFPLWGRPTATLAREMIDLGMDAVLTCVDPRVLPARFAGRRFDRALLAELPETVDPCGEKGEFHTFACAGPMFRAPIPVETGEVVERGGFVFADVLLKEPETR
jgi:diphthamide synthase (EF-2-diphthine--ammonia ligase)